MNLNTGPPPIPKRPGRNVRLVWWLLGGLGVLIVLPLALFYPVENWRGKRAWEKCKRELEAKGEKLDWTDYIPPPVPDEQNFFKAPKMAEWFVGRQTNELALRLDPERLKSFVKPLHTNAVVEVTVVSLDEDIAPGSAELVLRFNSPVLNHVSDTSSNASDPRLEIIPLVQFQDVALRIGILNLARQAGLKYELDAKLDFDDPDKPEPVINGRWEDVTAQQVLMRVLHQQNLRWIDDSQTGVARITTNPSGVSRVYVDPTARDQIRELIQKVVAGGTNNFPGRSMIGPQGFAFVVAPLGRVTPARVVVRSKKPPGLKEVAEFFPTNALMSNTQTVALRVEATANRYRVLLGPPPYTAAEYLAWSDQSKVDFDLIREALKRPYARMDGNYQNPFEIPLPSTIGFRSVAQTLGLRAQCQLLNDNSEEALHNLTLILDLCHVLESRPTGKPITLVAAMLKAAMVERYVQAVAEGLRLNAWQERQLVVIQSQLKAINLPLPVTAAFRGELTALEPELKVILAKKGAQSSSLDKGPWQKLKDAVRRPLLLVPEGWFYQNLVVIARLEQRLINGFDQTNRLVRVHEVEAFNREKETIGGRFRPYNFYAAIIMQGFGNAIQITAKNQILVDQAVIACALERYRIAHGKYPETLDALRPQFIEQLPHDIINGQPLKYRRTPNGQFVLYSVGWNETDDGGVAALKTSTVTDPQKGDWVWQVPMN